MADRTSISEWTSRHDIIPIEELSPHQQPSTANLTVPVLDLNAKYPEGGAYRNDSTVTETSDLVKSATVVTFEEVKLDRKQPSPVPRDRRWSVHENGSANEPQPQGIYWRSPISMAVFFFFGVMSCVGHHLYYMSWDKEEVGTDSQQQWVLRFGTAFAYIVQVSLVCSTGLAFTQYLWMTLKRTKVSVMALDAAFEADQTILSLLNPEFVWKMRTVAFLSLIAWCLPLPSLVTPGTLGIQADFRHDFVQQNVSRLDYSSFSQVNISTVSVLFNTLDGSRHALFLGPRTLISRLLTATAALGSILPISAPYPISSYELKFYGPSINCSQASPQTAVIIDALRNMSVATFNGSIKEVENNYFAFVPDFSEAGDESRLDNGIKVVSTTRLQQPTNASNQLWMVYSRWIWDENGNQSTRDYYSTCQLSNTSYHIDIAFNQGDRSQNITARRQDFVNLVDYPDERDPYTLDTMVKHAYSAFMWAITDLLVGSMGIFNKNSTENSGYFADFGEITTQLEHTSLLGTSDLDVYFDKHHLLSNSNISTIGQRWQDISLARNRTLEVLIPELAFNATMGLLSSNMTSPNFMTNVNHTTQINRYSYQASPLLIAYGFSISFALIAALLGGFAYYKNGHSHSRSFSSILASSRAAELTELFHDELMGRLPLHENVARTRLVFSRWGSVSGGSGHVPVNAEERDAELRREQGGWGFQVSHFGRPNLWHRLGDGVLKALRSIAFGKRRESPMQMDLGVQSRTKAQ